jgi:FkbM family methyltransferase
MKIIYVTPHLSTGGMPEYLRRKVELMLEDNEVWVVEKTFEREYRTIRDKIELLLGDRLITLNGNNETLLKLINDVNPDVVHFEELSDYHFTSDVLDLIYSDKRTYKIFDTLHDSSIDSKEKRFIPDKMLVVSPWQIKNFLDLDIPIEIIEHEIIPGIKNRELGLTKLNLDVDKKHVVQIGLFSRRKNQSKTFELARLMPDVQFHFVGNQTENYSDYWIPLLNDKPNNCIIWGERSDTELFYSCMDCVIFPSEGNYGDRETNPLVIREAIAWEVPLFLKDLPVYMGMYNESNKVKFMVDDITESTNTLYQIIKKEKKELNMEYELNNDHFKKKLFNISFDDSDNKINFEYLEFTRLDLKVCVRDIDTEVPIYTFDAIFENKFSLWCIPIPKQYYDFQNNPNFGGFLYDFYKDGKKVYTMTTRIKPSLIKKERFRIESFDPLFVNYEQFFTDKIYEKFFEQINKLESVIDIGANVGLFTELVLRKGVNKVKSIEINDVAIDIFKVLHSNNENVELITNAVSKGDGEIEIFIDPENSLVSSIFSNHTSNLINSKTIKTIGLNDLVKEQTSLVKMDVEGAEFDIFEGVSIETLKKIDFLLMEFHDNFGGILRDNILSKLENSGFTYEIFQDNCIDTASEWEERGTIFAKNNNK